MSATASAQAFKGTPDLLSLLSQRRAQAVEVDSAYAPAMASPEGTMTFWLAVAAKELREAAGRLHVHVAASMSKNQSTVYRFEEGNTVPRDLNLFIAAYADDLDIEPMQIWERALELWRESGEQATLADLLKPAGGHLRGLPGPGDALRPQRKVRKPKSA